MSQYYVGVMSGTSLDGIDVALVDFSNNGLDIVAQHTFSLPEKLARAMHHVVVEREECNLPRLGALDQEFGIVIADAINQLIVSAKIDQQNITAIGSHGITAIHLPDAEFPFTMQIGDPNQIVARTGITTITDFRRRDMALGGQGAPLAPAFHADVFSSETEKRVVVNIGGISNITLLSPNHKVTGFDTGPGNALLDVWHRQHHGGQYDANGTWAAGGNESHELMQLLLSDDYFARLPPKSTGKEKFNLGWVTGHLLGLNPPPEPQDVQATLAEITAKTIADSIVAHSADAQVCIVCGGGAHNDDLMRRLQKHLPSMRVESTENYGISPDFVEAAAFAWLAKQTMDGQCGNVPSVTGARTAAILGAIYPA